MTHPTNPFEHQPQAGLKVRTRLSAGGIKHPPYVPPLIHCLPPAEPVVVDPATGRQACLTWEQQMCLSGGTEFC